MFVMVEASPGAFKLRLVSNDDLIRDLKAQGALDGFLVDVDQLYAEFRSRFEHTTSSQRLISGQTEHVYGECRYATRRTWPWKRRVIYKAEVVRAQGKEPKDNPRFVVTNLKQSPQWIYEKVYCPRGDIENRIKELHDGMQIGRTSCSNFWANTFRVILTAAAYVLMQEMRLHLATTRWARAQVSTLRERFLKLGLRLSSRCGASCCTCRDRFRIEPALLTSPSVWVPRPAEFQPTDPSNGLAPHLLAVVLLPVARFCLARHSHRPILAWPAIIDLCCTKRGLKPQKNAPSANFINKAG
jgi:hypothetical protein